MTKRILVIGSGIVGASIAYHLAKAGANVAVLEANETPGGVATPQSWAWINASWGNPKPYFDLRQQSISDWHQCDREVPGLVVNWCGSLLWDLPEQQLVEFVEQQSGWGYGIRLLRAQEAQVLEPNVVNLPSFVAHAEGEGCVDPAAAATAFLEAAKRLGADVIPKARVKWLRERNGAVVGVMTAEGDLDADEVVLAVGVETNDVLKSIGLTLDLHSPPGLLIHTQPAPELISRMIIAPEMHVRQLASGHLIAGSDFRDEGFVNNPKTAAAAMMETLRQLVSGTTELQLDHFTFGQRPMPADGFPCCGRIADRAGLYVAVTHSGVTLAPAIGKLCAAELLQNARHPLLVPFTPDRLQPAPV